MDKLIWWCDCGVIVFAVQVEIWDVLVRMGPGAQPDP
jgi:hypothetical protein